MLRSKITTTNSWLCVSSYSAGDMGTTAVSVVRRSFKQLKRSCYMEKILCTYVQVCVSTVLHAQSVQSEYCSGGECE